MDEGQPVLQSEDAHFLEVVDDRELDVEELIVVVVDLPNHFTNVLVDGLLGVVPRALQR